MANLLDRVFRRSKPEMITSLVPSALSNKEVWHTILQGGGLGNLYSFGIAGTRDQAVQFAALYRCITLISSLGAELITGGSLRIVDRATGSVVNMPRHQEILNLLSTMPRWQHQCPDIL